MNRHNLKTPPCSKYPPAFGIDLLIDDSPGVEQEGRTHGFSVITVSPDNPDWAEKLLDEIDHLKPQNARIDEKNDSSQTVLPIQIENYLTDDENSLLYPWVLDKVSGTVRNQLPDSQTYAVFLSSPAGPTWRIVLQSIIQGKSLFIIIKSAIVPLWKS